ncbi:MAG: ABC transporter ATP-binding protein [Oscillospiraceae bacterium]
MLKINNLFCGYGGDDIVKNVSFDCNVGDCVAIIGPNGCGKTTLLRAINGLLPYKGSIQLFGREVFHLKRQEIAAEMAMLAQISSIYFDYSVYETVSLGRYLKAKNHAFFSHSDNDEIVLKCLRDAGLEDIRDRPITELSGGQLQRVFLARTFAQEPKIILLDEPTNFLDIRFQMELSGNLKSWLDEGGHTIIGIFHDLNVALEISNKCLLLNSGETVAFGETGEVLKSDELNGVYGCDVKKFMLNSLGKWKN